MALGYGWADAPFVERNEHGYAVDAALSAIIDDWSAVDGFHNAYESRERWLAVPLLDMSGTFDGNADVTDRRTAFALDDLEAQIERLNPGGLERARALCTRVAALCPTAPPPKLILMLDYD